MVRFVLCSQNSFGKTTVKLSCKYYLLFGIMVLRSFICPCLFQLDCLHIIHGKCGPPDEHDSCFDILQVCFDLTTVRTECAEKGGTVRHTSIIVAVNLLELCF